jgi:hypothetical protein
LDFNASAISSTKQSQMVKLKIPQPDIQKQAEGKFALDDSRKSCHTVLDFSQAATAKHKL